MYFKSYVPLSFYKKNRRSGQLIGSMVFDKRLKIYTKFTMEIKGEKQGFCATWRVEYLINLLAHIRFNLLL